jgi:capsular polysaccharide biosynthesis protein
MRLGVVRRVTAGRPGGQPPGPEHRSALENAKILSPVALPLRPVFPNLPLNLALVVSLAVGLLLEYWDDSLTVPEEVERCLNRPVFASFPEL